MTRLIATTRVCLIDEMSASKARTREDLRRVIQGYDSALASPMVDLVDKQQLKKMRNELIEQLADLEE